MCENYVTIEHYKHFEDTLAILSSPVAILQRHEVNSHSPVWTTNSTASFTNYCITFIQKVHIMYHINEVFDWARLFIPILRTPSLNNWRSSGSILKSKTVRINNSFQSKCQFQSCFLSPLTRIPLAGAPRCAVAFSPSPGQRYQPIRDQN